MRRLLMMSAILGLASLVPLVSAVAASPENPGPVTGIRIDPDLDGSGFTLRGRDARQQLIVTADHGNCEEMVDEASGEAHTAHTMNKVPFILINGPQDVVGLADGALSDIAPSLLDIMGVEKPAAMTGVSLIRRTSDAAVAE